jgi:quercetin dioxygenase-like cupin family protein
MPIEIRRFGVGHRRADGPPGTVGIASQLLHSDRRGVVTELAFGRGARIEPHSNPNTTYFIVIEGGGWVLVGDERSRIAAGEAAIWPPNVPHGAWTELSTMRAFIVEYAGSDDAHLAGILEGSAREIDPDEGRAVARAEGRLVERPRPPVDRDPSSGEPL